MLEAANKAALAGLSPADGESIHLQGYHSPGDGGGQFLRWINGDSTTADDGWVFDEKAGGRYHALDRTYADVRRFGAKDSVASQDFVYDSQPAIQAALAAAQTVGKTLTTTRGSAVDFRRPAEVFFPAGGYRIGVPITIAGAGKEVVLRGQNAVFDWLDDTADNAGVGPLAQRMIDWQGAWKGRLSGLTFLNARFPLRLGQANNNQDAGKIEVENCHLIGYDGGTDTNDAESELVEIYSRSCVVMFRDCYFDNIGKHALNIKSCDRVRIENCQFKVGAESDDGTPPVITGHWDAYAARTGPVGLIRMQAGTLQIRQSLFTPPTQAYEDWVGGPANPLEKPIGWIIAEGFPGYPSASNSTSFWCTVDVEGCMFGAEGRGLTPLIWNQDPADDYLIPEFGFRLVNNKIGCANECGATDADTGHKSTPAVILTRIPNRAVVRGNELNAGRSVAMDYLRGATPPTPHLPTDNKRLDLSVSANIGGQGTQLGGLDPNWIPADLARPVLPSGTSTIEASYYRGRIVRTANASATSITAFRGGSDGQAQYIQIDDANTTIVHNASKIATLSGADITERGIYSFIKDQSAGVWAQEDLMLGTVDANLVSVNGNATDRGKAWYDVFSDEWAALRGPTAKSGANETHKHPDGTDAFTVSIDPGTGNRNFS